MEGDLMLKRFIFISLAVCVLVLGIIAIFMIPGPDLSKYEYLSNPQIRNMENQRMVVVEARGNPDVVGKKAFSLLFKTYFKIKGVTRGPKQPAPRARWPFQPNQKNIEWRGLYAMPVPQGTTLLPAVKSDPEITIRLDTWEYGTVAEILHVGPYDREEQDIARLTAFIKDKGYSIVGDHEEEYLKGPGMFLKGDPEKYYTIIRYRIIKQ
jgi:hypothetical protein